MGKYIFSILKDGKVIPLTANSANHAKQMRSDLVKDKSVVVLTSHIINMQRPDAFNFPMLLKPMKIKVKKDGG
jgi:hypothetical protein